MGLLNAEVEVGETLFESNFRPDPANALDVLAFVLTKPEAFMVDKSDPEELEAIRYLLAGAKAEAISRWVQLNKR